MQGSSWGGGNSNQKGNKPGLMKVGVEKTPSWKKIIHSILFKWEKDSSPLFLPCKRLWILILDHTSQAWLYHWVRKSISSLLHLLLTSQSWRKVIMCTTPRFLADGWYKNTQNKINKNKFASKYILIIGNVQTSAQTSHHSPRNQSWSLWSTEKLSLASPVA